MFSGTDQLTGLGFGMVITFMTLIMTRRLSPIIALILVPACFALLGGFAGSMGGMMLSGIQHLAPTGIMLMFAILYFSVMHDAGLFEPLVKTTLKLAEGDPLKVLVGTALLSLLVSLDGDGSTTYIIVITALLPLYRQLNINPLFLSGIVMLAVGVTNITPWGGPTARAASALHLDPNALFTPMIPAMLGCICWVVCVAILMGLWERRRLAKLPPSAMMAPMFSSEALPGEDPSAPVPYLGRRGVRMAVNALLTVTLLVLLVWGVCPMPVLFMLAFALAMMINFPNPEAQKERLRAHAPSILMVISLIFAAGIFTGILSGTHMVDAMTQSMLALISKDMGPHLPVITAMVSLPLTFFISNDAFYFGMLPLLSKAAAAYGISAAEMGRAAIVGQPVHVLSPLVPSTYLLVNLSQVDFVAHQRFTILWAIVTCLVMLLVGVGLHVIPL